MKPTQIIYMPVMKPEIFAEMQGMNVGTVKEAMRKGRIPSVEIDESYNEDGTEKKKKAQWVNLAKIQQMALEG